MLALYFDARPHALGLLLSAVLGIGVAGVLIATRARPRGLFISLAAVAAVAIWWLQLAPSNDQNWQADVQRLAWAEVNGDEATIHNVRNCDYRSETDYTPHWETRSIAISEIDGVDLFLVHWGSPWIAHAILSFHSKDGEYLSMSIEARQKVGQSYSALRGFFRQYNLIYLAAEERDVVRLRTNFRHGEDVRLYRTRTTAHDAQRLFLAYIGWMNATRNHPEWYNALTGNCTSGIVHFLKQQKVGGLADWDWRTLLNGRGDEMLYQLGDFVTDGLSLSQLQSRALINPVAKRAGDAADFSRIIRAGRPGFTKQGEPEPLTR